MLAGISHFKRTFTVTHFFLFIREISCHLSFLLLIFLKILFYCLLSPNWITLLFFEHFLLHPRLRLRVLCRLHAVPLDTGALLIVFSPVSFSVLRFGSLPSIALHVLWVLSRPVCSSSFANRFFPFTSCC